MWRTLAGGIALALMAIPGSGANAAGKVRPAADHREKAPRNERIAQAAQAPRQATVEPTATATEDGSTKGHQSPALDGDATSDQSGEAAASPGFQTTKNLPEMLNRTEMLSLARKYAADIAESLVDGERKRETAVRQKDAIKLACIQDRLSNMKTMKRMADERLAATARPSVRQDELNLRHEFRSVEEAHKRVVELRRELNECVGESLEVTGPTGGVPATVEPTGSNAETPRMERPTPASIFQ